MSFSTHEPCSRKFNRESTFIHPIVGQLVFRDFCIPFPQHQLPTISFSQLLVSFGRSKLLSDDDVSTLRAKYRLIDIGNDGKITPYLLAQFFHKVHLNKTHNMFFILSYSIQLYIP